MITFNPTTYIVDKNGAKPCIARIYKDVQWRQCKIKYYNLYPLLDKQSRNILDIQNRPIYVAQLKTS